MKPPRSAAPHPAQRVVELVSRAVGRADMIGDRVVMITREEAAEILLAANELKPAEGST